MTSAFEPRFVGSVDDAARELVHDVLLSFGAAHERPRAVIFVFPPGRALREAVRDARAGASGDPVVLVLPFPDDVLVAAGRAAGADACLCFGQPIALWMNALAPLLGPS